MYTNLDMFHNKKSELLIRISQTHPDIIGLTELNPKAAFWDLCETDLTITGYTLYYDLTGRGAALYVNDNLRSTEIKSSITHNGSVCIIPLKKGDSLLVGVIYRSPNADTAQNDYLNAVMKKMVEKRNSHLMIMGDFNYLISTGIHRQCLPFENER